MSNSTIKNAECSVLALNSDNCRALDASATNSIPSLNATITGCINNTVLIGNVANKIIYELLQCKFLIDLSIILILMRVGILIIV